MPGITGKEMARKMLRIRQDIPIILSTGFSASVSPEKMRNTGIRDIIYKPFLPSELLDKIRHILKSETSFPVPGDS